MNITFTPEPIPELTIESVTLAKLGFTAATDAPTSPALDHCRHRRRHLGRAVRSQPRPARFGGGLGAGERRGDYR